MNHPPLSCLRVLAAACLLFVGTAWAASPPPSDEDTIAALQRAYARAVVPGPQADLYRDLLANILQRVKRSHATEVDLASFAVPAMKVLEPLQPGVADAAETFKKSINESLRALDPYSRYIDLRGQATASSESTGTFGGLGLEVQSAEGAVRVVAPIPGSPAARAGLAAGDLIVRVDDTPLAGVPLADAIAKMRGEPGTPVTITVQRGTGANEFTVSLKRDTIRRQLVRWSMEGEVLVLRLAEFTGPVASSMAQAITEATLQSTPRAIILDLRGNPGGLLREAIKVADTFLAEGEIVSLRGNSPARSRTWQADPDQMLAGLPMVVLVDVRSASASELVADALQYNGRATVMGQRSYGKGTVQTTFPLGENRGALKLTTSLYHGPSGQTVQKVGVAPDIELVSATAIATAAADARAPGDADVPLRPAKARVDPARCTAIKASDPAISCAVSFLLSSGVDAFVAGLPQ